MRFWDRFKWALVGGLGYMAARFLFQGLRTLIGGYAARFPVLLEGVGKLFSGTFDAIYSDTQTDTLAVFLSCTVLALVAALFFTLWHNTKK